MIRLTAAILAALATCPAALADTVAYYPVNAGAHPHDVAAAPDGTVFYTAQSQGALGILDPKTGKVEQVSLGKGAAPHGVIVGPDGAAWITEGGQNAIARFDPKTKEVKLFPLPKGFERANLNTATFDRQGILWFTGQGGVYGRVDPATGKVDAWKAPKGYGPYGIAATPTGEVWFVSLAGDYLAKVDRSTGATTVVEPPKPGVGPRRVWSDSKGMLWVSFWNSGEVGRYDPKARTWKTWAMPTGKGACYSVYVDDKDFVWLTDWLANAIVRFDPTTETFASFPSNRKSSSIRQTAGRRGEVWGGESGTNRPVVARGQ